jgi:hypothetical protein
VVAISAGGQDRGCGKRQGNTAAGIVSFGDLRVARIGNVSKALYQLKHQKAFHQFLRKVMI